MGVGEGKQADGEVSPAEAQNTGPAHRGPAREPDPATETSAEADASGRLASPIRPGGGEATRDDL